MWRLVVNAAGSPYITIQAHELMFLLFRRQRLGKPNPPLADYLVSVHVLPEPSRLEDWPEPGSAGCYQAIGLRVSEEDLEASVEEAICFGAVDWSETEWYEATDRTLPRKIQRLVSSVDSGIWYESGRIFY